MDPLDNPFSPGVGPTYWRKFDGGVSDEARVKQVVEWLSLPAEKRPHFITLYFGEVDAAGHRFGAESLETASAALEVDRILGKLRQEVDATKLPVNLISVSDHGMQDVTDGWISLAGVFDGLKAHAEADGPVALIYCQDPETVEKTYRKLAKNSRIGVYRREETPAWWHFKDNPRGGDLVAIVKGAAVFTLSDPDARRRSVNPPQGEHGYDPRKFQSMHAIFYAIGPNIRRETRIPSCENVNVYPLIARILSLKLAGEVDGSESVLDPIYRP